MGLVEAVFRGLMIGLASPLVFIPAWAIGWFVRAWWQVAAGAVVLAGLLFALSLRSLPEGARVVWWLVPLGVLPPLIHAAAAYLLRGWLGRNHGTEGASLGVRLISAAIGLAVGACVGGAVGFAVGSIYVELARVSTMEGNAGYLVFFAFVFPGVLIGGGLGVFLSWRLAVRRWAATPKA